MADNDREVFNARKINEYNEELKKAIELQRELYKTKLQSGNLDDIEKAHLQEQLRLSIEKLKQENAAKQAEAAAALARREEYQRLNRLEQNLESTREKNRRTNEEEDRRRREAGLFDLSLQERLFGKSLEQQRIKKQNLEIAKQELEVASQKLREAEERGASQEEIAELRANLGTAQANVNISEAASNRAEQNSQRLEKILGSIENTLKSSASSIINIVDRNITLYSQYMGKVTARLQSIDANSGKSFSTVVDKLSTLGTSPYVSQKQLYENIDRLSSEGISYNLEERAFLASLSDKIVNSFDVGNATLTRLIRLYQEDFTQAMLGSEAWLTQIFNSMYEDTSYLKNVDDSVMSALTDVMATLDRSDALQFQYDVQKWLGAMYEVGVSSESLLSIANAINALGTGNASGFESSPSNILMNLAIARSDYSLADILTQGLTSEAINDILKSVVELLIDIKDNTSNQATLNAYANVMGVSIADIRGFYNLQQDITELYNQTMDIETAENEVQNQLTAIIYDRTTLQEKIDTALENIAVTLGMNIADKDGAYTKWLLGKALVSVGSNIPGMVGSGLSIAGYADLFGVLGASLFRSFTESSVGNDNGGSFWSRLFGDNDRVALKSFLSDGINNILSGFTGDNLISFLLSSTDLSVTGNRGSNYVGVKPDYGNVTSSLSSSFSAKNIGSTEGFYNDIAGSIASEVAQSSGLANLEPLSTQSGYGYDVYSSESENEGYNEYDIFEELFYHQEHPIRVHLAYFDDEAMSQLKYEGHMQNMYDLAIGSGIKADLIEADVSTIISNIYGVRMG